MAKQDIAPRKTDSIEDEIARLHEDISRRAYEFFRNPDGFSDGPLGDWLRAERELVRRPPIDLRQKDGAVELDVDVAGVDPKDLDVKVTPHEVLIKAKTRREGEKTVGTVHVREFSSGELFRSVRFPEPIDADSVKTDCRNGVFHFTAKIAKAAPKAAAAKVA